MENSLYERIGGDEAVSATVNKMYDKILVDPELAPFFENIDVTALRRSQTAFVIFAFGGNNQKNISRDLRISGKVPSQGYPENYLRNAHSNAVAQGLSDKHFDRVAAHLKEAMQELSVPGNLINEVMSVISSTRKEVLNQ